jgi:nicotinamide mononucleotide transporter
MGIGTQNIEKQIMTMWISFLNYLAASWLENVAAVITLVGIWLTTRRTLLCWPVVLVSDVLYLIVFYRENLKSDTLLQVFFIAFTLYSWWNWWRGVRVDGEVRVMPLRLRDWIAALIVGAIGSVVVGWWMARIGAALPHLDAALAVFSLVASWWEARKHTANWWLWIVVDSVYVGEYLYKDMWTTAALYTAFVVLAVLGLRDWQRAAKAIQTAN